MKNTILAIGIIGYRKCYLNITKEEALQRYINSENNIKDVTLNDVNIIEFDDEFTVYDIFDEE